MGWYNKWNGIWGCKIGSFFTSLNARALNGIKDPTWNVVIETKPHNLYEMPSDEEESSQEEDNLHCNVNVMQEEEEEDDGIDWSRSDVDNMIIEWFQMLQLIGTPQQSNIEPATMIQS